MGVFYFVWYLYKMKKTLTYTESELVKVINRIVESYNDDTYDDEDYLEVFFNYFRPWVKKTHGDEVGEYPFSYLIKKYMMEFVKDYGMNPEYLGTYGYRGTISNATRIGKEIVKQGKHKLPSLRASDKFTEKYKKPLEFFIESMNLPDFMKLTFTEKTPYKVEAGLDIDWERFIKYQGDKTFRYDSIKREIEQRIQDFLGVEIGNPTHGQLSFNFYKNYIGVDEWVKNTLNKEVKKKIRELPNAKRMLHSIKFETTGHNLGGELKFSMKSWNGRNDFLKEVRQLLQSMGYNTEILKVVH